MRRKREPVQVASPALLRPCIRHLPRPCPGELPGGPSHLALAPGPLHLKDQGSSRRSSVARLHRDSWAAGAEAVHQLAAGRGAQVRPELRLQDEERGSARSSHARPRPLRLLWRGNSAPCRRAPGGREGGAHSQGPSVERLLCASSPSCPLYSTSLRPPDKPAKWAVLSTLHTVTEVLRDQWSHTVGVTCTMLSGGLRTLGGQCGLDAALVHKVSAAPPAGWARLHLVCPSSGPAVPPRSPGSCRHCHPAGRWRTCVPTAVFPSDRAPGAPGPAWAAKAPGGRAG